MYVDAWKCIHGLGRRTVYRNAASLVDYFLVKCVTVDILDRDVKCLIVRSD